MASPLCLRVLGVLGDKVGRSDLARGEPALGNRHGQRTGGGDHGFGQLDFGRALVFDAQNLAGEFWPPVFGDHRSEDNTSELQSLMRNSYAVFCLKKKTN